MYHMVSCVLHPAVCHTVNGPSIAWPGDAPSADRPELGSHDRASERSANAARQPAPADGHRVEMAVMTVAIVSSSCHVSSSKR